jgi:hypothetical protein
VIETVQCSLPYVHSNTTIFLVMAIAIKIIRDLASVTSCIDLSVRIVTKSPKAGPPLIFSISLGSPENNGPDEAEGEPGVPVHDVVRPHVLQVHPLLVQEAGGGGGGH